MPESFGPMDPLQDPLEGESQAPLTPPSFGQPQGAGGPPAADAIFEAVARRNAELEAEDVTVTTPKSFLDVGLQFYSDLRKAKDDKYDV
jgi:hypothetical protein